MLLQIDIIDRNDNSPSFDVVSSGVIFDGSEVVIDVMEECLVGTTLISVNGRDNDQGKNGEVVFEIIGDVNRLLALTSHHSGTIKNI